MFLYIDYHTLGILDYIPYQKLVTNHCLINLNKFNKEHKLQYTNRNTGLNKLEQS